MSCSIRCKTAKTNVDDCECSCGGEHHGQQSTILEGDGVKLAYCEHAFEDEDPNHPGYSLREVDLSPHVGRDGVALSLRHNKEKDRYEIFNHRHENPYSDEAVHYHYKRLKQAIRTANDLESERFGSEKLEYGHDAEKRYCPGQQVAS